LIRLEDTKGSEQIFVHGEKNVDIRIKNDEYKNIDNNLNLIINKDRYEHIKNDHHETTDNDQFIKAGRDHHFTVGGKQAIKVTGTRTLQVTGDVTEVFKSNHSEDVTMAYYLKAGMTIVIESTAGITLKCGSNSVVVDPTGVTVTGSLVTVTGQLTKINSGPGSPPGVGTAGQPVSPTAPEDATEADKADPGEMAHIKAEQEQAGKGKYGTISPASHTPSTVAAAAAAQQATDPKAPPKTWIEIELVNKDGDPVPGEKYSIKLPDGSVAEGTLDDHGKARVDGIDPGSCQVTFPNMDQTVWEPKS
jgi:type VI secretion system secreted protein VgrG